MYITHKGLSKELENLEIKGQVKTNYSIIKIGPNTEKSPGDLRRLVVTQFQVKTTKKLSKE